MNGESGGSARKKKGAPFWFQKGTLHPKKGNQGLLRVLDKEESRPGNKAPNSDLKS